MIEKFFLMCKDFLKKILFMPIFSDPSLVVGSTQSEMNMAGMFIKPCSSQ
jgi:hypothetical protein